MTGAFATQSDGFVLVGSVVRKERRTHYSQKSPPDLHTHPEHHVRINSIIRGAPRRQQKHLFRLARGKATAVIRNVNKDAIAVCVGIQRDFGVAPRKLERVIQQVAHRREQRGLVGVNRQFGVNSRHG